MVTWTFMKKLFHNFPSCILPSFSQNASRLLLPKRLWKCASTISFPKYKQKVVLLVIYLFHYDSSKSTFFMLNMAFDVVLSTVLTNKLQFLKRKDCKNILLFAQPVCFDLHLFNKKLIFHHHGDNSNSVLTSCVL